MLDYAQPLGLMIDDFGDVRDFTAAILAADWVCYPAPEDRVDVKRLEYILSLFPAGFRLWQCPDMDGVPHIVGYSGWYPISSATWHMLTLHADGLSHRGEIMPCVPPQSDHCYIFNYSLIPEAQKSPASRAMLSALGQDIAGMKPAAITVSPDGMRIAQRFGMSPCGTLKGDTVWAVTG